MEVRDPYGRIRGRTEEIDEEGNPIGRLTVSTSLNPWELPETNQRASLTPTHTHICNRGMPCLASVREDLPNLGETCCPRRGNAPQGVALSEAKGRWTSGRILQGARTGRGRQHLRYK